LIFAAILFESTLLGQNKKAHNRRINLLYAGRLHHSLHILQMPKLQSMLHRFLTVKNTVFQNIPLITIIRTKQAVYNIFFKLFTLSKGEQIMASKDKCNEGKDELYLDIDRMVNEGMAGGTISNHEDLKQIGYDTDITAQEEPPTVAGKNKAEDK
jgi:hypothetical protein